MKCKYTRPEITISKFETNDVISTSCTDKGTPHLSSDATLDDTYGKDYIFMLNANEIWRGCYQFTGNHHVCEDDGKTYDIFQKMPS